MKKGTLVIASTILVVIGLILLVSSLSITGNVISNKIGKTTGSILGLALIIGGILLFQLERAGGLEVKIYATTKPLEERKSEEDTTKFWITDPHMIFGGIGKVSLEEFKEGIKKLKSDPTPELIEIARDAYVSDLEEYIAQGGEKEYRAKLFYNVLMGPRVAATLSTEQREKIKRVMKSFDPKRGLNKEQREVLGEYDIIYEIGKSGRGHNKLKSPYGDKAVSISPSTKNFVEAVTSDVIDLARRYLAHEKD